MQSIYAKQSWTCMWLCITKHLHGSSTDVHITEYQHTTDGCHHVVALPLFTCAAPCQVLESVSYVRQAAMQQHRAPPTAPLAQQASTKTPSALTTASCAHPVHIWLHRAPLQSPTAQLAQPANTKTGTACTTACCARPAHTWLHRAPLQSPTAQLALSANTKTGTA
jgi:hypothetical protein